ISCGLVMAAAPASFIWRGTCTFSGHQLVIRKALFGSTDRKLVQRRRFAMSDEYNMESKSGASWHLPAIIVLALIAIGGLAFGWNASSKLDATQQAVTTQVNSFKQGLEQDMSSLKDRIAQDEKANTDLQGDLKVITDKLKITQGQLKKARAEAVAANQDTTQK